MNIIDLMPFCLSGGSVLGIATGEAFASSAWVLSQELFDSTSGRKFTWIAPDGNTYVDDKALFRRPTAKEVMQFMTPIIQTKAQELQLIEA